jgi:hypothetical protein
MTHASPAKRSLRNLVVAGGMSLAFPGLHLAWERRRWRRYPFGLDSLHLCIFWLDMAGNSLNLYDRHLHFDLVPHFPRHSTLHAICRVVSDVLRTSAGHRSALGRLHGRPREAD